MTSKTNPKPTYRRANVQPREITQLCEFRPREGGIDKAHVRTLMQALRNKGSLEPILLWRDNRDPARPRLVLLDGGHRLAAHRSMRRHGHRSGGGVPAKIVECDTKQAHLLALARNTRDCLPLTTTERTNAAWGLVRHPTLQFSKAEIAHASGISPSTVANMRRRLKEMAEAGEEVSGNWWRDRQGNRDEAPDDLSDNDVEARAKALADELRGPLSGWKRERTEVLAMALEGIFGHQLRYIVDFLFCDDEFADFPVSTDTGTTTEGDF